MIRKKKNPMYPNWEDGGKTGKLKPKPQIPVGDNTRMVTNNLKQAIQGQVYKRAQPIPHFSTSKLSPIKRLLVSGLLGNEDSNVLQNTYNKLVDYKNEQIRRGNKEFSKEERKFREKLAKVFKYGYPTDLAQLKDISNRLKNNIEQAPQFSKSSLNDPGDSLRSELSRQYFGVNYTPKYLSESFYVPSTSSSKGIQYKDFSPEVRESIVGSLSFDGLEKAASNNDRSGAINIARNNGYVGEDRYQALKQLGSFKLSKGKDDRGEYVSYYDIWDIDPPLINDEGIDLNKLNNPFEIYGRLYKDEWDKTRANTKASSMKNTKKNYGGKIPPPYKYGGSVGRFVDGNMFTDDFPNYIPDYNGIDSRGIPPKVYEFGGTAPSDAIPVQGPFPYQTYGYESGYGQIPPPKVYDNGGIVPTSNSFAASPFPRDYRWETYPSYISEYPNNNAPTAYLGEAAFGMNIPGDPPGGPVGDTTTGKKPIIGTVDIYGNVVNTPNLTRTGTAINNEVQDQKRLQYIQQLSKKYGVPTNQIYSKRARRYNDAYQDVDNKYLEYELQDPQSKKWLTFRQNFDDKAVGYPTGAYNPSRENGGYAESGIHIKPENRGKFNATKKRTGKTTEELTHSSNPVTRKRAIFAQNAAKWDHANNGGGPYGDILPVYNPMTINYPNIDIPIDDSLQNPIPTSVNTNGGMNDNVNTGRRFGSIMKGIGNAIGGMLGGMTFNTAGPIMGLGALSNAFTRGQEAVSESATQTRRNVTQGPIYNPYRYGTGSSALYTNGGTITDDNSIQQAIMTLRNAGYDVQMD